MSYEMIIMVMPFARAWLMAAPKDASTKRYLSQLSTITCAFWAAHSPLSLGKIDRGLWNNHYVPAYCCEYTLDIQFLGFAGHRRITRPCVTFALEITLSVEGKGGKERRRSYGRVFFLYVLRPFNIIIDDKRVREITPVPDPGDNCPRTRIPSGEMP